jgi:TolB-like protein/DNA-binding winged helix-turn-helix (wHTH) protein/Flp pilus assembly protein TadD
MPMPASNVLRFGVFELDSDSGELRRHGLKIRLPDQSFHVLKTLLSRPGEVVTREELRHVLWTSGTFVDFEVGLNSAVKKLREALDDAADNPRFVETLPRRGYRFVASVSAAAADPAVLSRSVEPAAEPTVQLSTGPVAGAAATAPPRSRVALFQPAVIMLVLVVAGSGLYQRGGLVTRPGPPADPIRSLVVLPFENLTGDAGQEYFVDSVTDAVTAHLAQVAGLDVISSTSARQYKQTGKRLPEIGKELQVDGIVEGAVARSGTGVRITAKLIRAATDRNVWADMYEEDVSRMLTVQHRIASDVAVAAGRPQPDAGRAPHTINSRAYDAYVKGLTAKGLQRHEGFLRSVRYFEEAVAIQPDFGEAYAALALSQVQLLFGGPLSPHETIPKAEAAARKALQLDATLSQAHWALGQILSLYYWRWEEGAQSLQRAEALRGGREELSTAVSESLIRRGLLAEAIVAAERGRKLDPLSVGAQVAAGNAYRAAGQHDRAVTELRRALEMSPRNSRVHFQLGVTYVRMGRLDDAIRELEIAVRSGQGHNSRLEAYLGYAYAVAGRMTDARLVLNELESHRREQYVSSFGIALIHDALGEKAPALAALQRACEDRAVEFAQMLQYPPFKAIASEPAYRAVMTKVGLQR